jgi:lysozyme family protein
MNNRFDIFIPIILKHEGGYVWDKDDWGGETNFGITKRRYPDLDIKNLTVGEARDLYYKDFYVRMNLYYLRSDLLALHVLDMGVNAGRKTAVKLLQGLLRGCDNDGVIGPITGQAVEYANITTDLVEVYKAKRIERYYEVSLRRRNSKYLKGWVNRVYSTKL